MSATKGEMELAYKKSVYNAGKGKSPSALKKKFGGEWYYYVYTPNNESDRKYIKNEWKKHGFNIRLSDAGLFYVRRK